MQKVVDLTEHGMVDTSEEENSRVMKSCVESAIGQMVGLSYSSLVDPTWVKGKPLTLVLDENACIQCQAEMRYQCLPVGSTVADALRINIRFDIPGFPANASATSEFLTAISTDVAKLRRQYDESSFHFGLDITEAFPFRRIGESMFACFRFVHTFGENKLTSLMVSSSKEVAMYPEAFPADTRTESMEENGRLLVKIHASSTCSLRNVEAGKLKENEQSMDDLITYVFKRFPHSGTHEAIPGRTQQGVNSTGSGCKYFAYGVCRNSRKADSARYVQQFGGQLKLTVPLRL